MTTTTGWQVVNLTQHGMHVFYERGLVCNIISYVFFATKRVHTLNCKSKQEHTCTLAGYHNCVVSSSKRLFSRGIGRLNTVPRM